MFLCFASAPRCFCAALYNKNKGGTSRAAQVYNYGKQIKSVLVSFVRFTADYQMS